MATRDAVIGGFYANEPRKITLSSTSSTSYSAKWYRREKYPEDPWISLVDHHESADNILYGEASFEVLPEIQNGIRVLQYHNGANVWVRYIPKGTKT